MSTTPTTTTWNIDPAHSAAEFKVKHMMISNVKGKFSGICWRSSRSTRRTPQSPALKFHFPWPLSATGDAQRDGHLQECRLFPCGRAPHHDFQVHQGGAPPAAREHAVTGDLTVHGVTKPVTLCPWKARPNPARTHGATPTSVSSATTKINRKDFGLSLERGAGNRRRDGGRGSDPHAGCTVHQGLRAGCL